jgi:hypothetical protein
MKLVIYMNTLHPFVFNGKYYYAGTIVEIYSEYVQQFKFNSILKFVGYNISENAYYFSSLYNVWDIYKLSYEEISIYIHQVLQENQIQYDNHVNENYIDGIVSAWIWYILAILFSLCLQGIGNVICALVFATVIFYHWRNKKIRGG